MAVGAYRYALDAAALVFRGWSGRAMRNGSCRDQRFDEHEDRDDDHRNREHSLQLLPGQMLGAVTPERHAEQPAGNETGGDCLRSATRGAAGTN